MSSTPHGATKLNSPPKGRGIFISYRRSDSSGYVGRIAEKLRKNFRRRHVFRDLSTLVPGDKFPDAIRKALQESSVLLAIVGPEWLQTKDENGQARLSKPEDFVRLEILTALEQRLRVIPVLVGNAGMPKAHELPKDLQEFADCHAFELSDLRWEYDLGRLVAAIRPTVDPGFRVRRVSLALMTMIAIVVGVMTTKYVVQNRQIERAGQMIEKGNAEDAFKLLQDLDSKNAPGKADPRIYLHEAEVYQSRGDATNQNATAVKAARLALDRGDNLTAGRASMLACDAKNQLGLRQEALSECEDAKKYSDLAKDDVGHVRAINAQGNILWDMNQSKAAGDLYQEALDFALTHKLVLDQYGASNNLGLALQDQGELEKARRRFEFAKDGFEKAGLLGEASNACSNLGTVSFNQGNIAEAERYFEEAIQLADKSNDKSRAAQAHVNKGLFHEQSGSLTLAEAEFQTAMGLYQSLPSPAGVGFVKNTLGDMYLQEAKYGDAGQAYSDGSKVPEVQGWSEASLVNLDLQQGHSSATELSQRIDEAIQNVEKAGDEESESFARLMMARVLLELRRTEEAKQEAEKALGLARKLGQLDNVLAARIVLAEIKAANGAVDEALKDLQSVADSTYRKNVPRNLEARLALARVMLQFGSAKQRSDAKVLLQGIKSEAHAAGDLVGYDLWAAKAQALLSGKSQVLAP